MSVIANHNDLSEGTRDTLYLKLPQTAHAEGNKKVTIERFNLSVPDFDFILFTTIPYRLGPHRKYFLFKYSCRGSTVLQLWPPWTFTLAK